MTPLATKLLWAGGAAAVILTGVGIAVAATSKSTSPSPNPQPNPNPQPSPGPLPGPGCPPGTTWSVPAGNCVPLGPGPTPTPGDPWSTLKTKMSVLLLTVNTLKSIGTGLLSDPVRADGQWMYDTASQLLASGAPPPANPTDLGSLAAGNAQLQVDNATVQSWADQTAMPPGTAQASASVAAAGNDVLIAAMQAQVPQQPPMV